MKAKFIYITRETAEKDYYNEAVRNYNCSIDENLPSCKVGVGTTKPTDSLMPSRSGNELLNKINFN
jgi:hypothetical protein